MAVILLFSNQLEEFAGLGRVLTADGHLVEMLQNTAADLLKAKRLGGQVALVDIRSPEDESMKVFMDVHEAFPRIETIALANPSLLTLSQPILREGAFDFILYPQISAFAQNAVRNALTFQRLRCERHILANHDSPAYDELKRGKVPTPLETDDESAPVIVDEAPELDAEMQLAKGFVHTMNNAFCVIIGFAKLMEMDLKEGDQNTTQKRHLTRILDASQDGVDFVQRVRSFCRDRDKSDAYVLLDARGMAEEAIERSRARLAANEIDDIRIVAQLEDVPPILGSENELRAMLEELMLNAETAVNGGGTVTMACAQVADFTRLSVCDTGVGMDETARRRCVEPFYSTKGVRGGGLGLSMAYGITTRHGGTMTVDSHPGDGTCVTILLPTHAAAEPAPTLASPASSAKGSGPYQILIVDDDELICEFLGELLSGVGHRVETATSSEKGIGAWKAKHFDLAIVDRVMPNLTGDKLAGIFKELRPEAGVIMATGYAGVMEEDDSHAAGIDAVIRKPFVLQDLLEAIKGLKLPEHSSAASSSN